MGYHWFEFSPLSKSYPQATDTFTLILNRLSPQLLAYSLSTLKGLERAINFMIDSWYNHKGYDTAPIVCHSIPIERMMDA